MKPPITIVRYKKDLRITDHKPLYEACQKENNIIALYVREKHIMWWPDYSHFHQYRIQESLKDLKKSLYTLHIPLLMRYWEIEEVLAHVQEYYTITHIYSHEETWNNLTYIRDKKIIKYCQSNNIVFTEYPHNAVVRRLQSRDLWDTIRKERIFDTIILIPQKQNAYILNDILLEKAKKLFTHFTPAAKPDTRIYERDIPGEKAGQKRLDYFLTHAWPYRYALSRPDLAVKDSSRLSAYITYGNLSIRQIYQACTKYIAMVSMQAKSKPDSDTKNIKRQIGSLIAFRSRLHRHCHFIQKLESQPSIEYDNQNKAFNTIRTEVNHELIQARYTWQTWIPMIDAGMRCLHATGWINFRMRATLISFICNTCMQPWQSIWPMLARIFVDYEPWIHYSQLQMQSGTTWINTIRIYNPIKQLQDKDTDLVFIRSWIPELSALSTDEIMQLWTLAWNSIISTKHIDYPHAIIDVIQWNKYARVALWWVRKTDKSKSEAKKVYTKLGSRKRTNTTTHKKKSITQDSLFT